MCLQVLMFQNVSMMLLEHRKPSVMIRLSFRCFERHPMVRHSCWRHQVETFPRYWSSVRAIHRRPIDSLHKVTRNFDDVFFDLCLNKWLSKQTRSRWFEMSLRSLWRHCNDLMQISHAPTSLFRPTPSWWAVTRPTKDVVRLTVRRVTYRTAGMTWGCVASTECGPGQISSVKVSFCLLT